MLAKAVGIEKDKKFCYKMSHNLALVAPLPFAIKFDRTILLSLTQSWERLFFVILEIC
jgi:hypothetical protein